MLFAASEFFQVAFNAATLRKWHLRRVALLSASVVLCTVRPQLVPYGVPSVALILTRVRNREQGSVRVHASRFSALNSSLCYANKDFNISFYLNSNTNQQYI